MSKQLVPAKYHQLLADILALYELSKKLCLQMMLTVFLIFFVLSSFATGECPQTVYDHQVMLKILSCSSSLDPVLSRINELSVYRGKRYSQAELAEVKLTAEKVLIIEAEILAERRVFPKQTEWSSLERGKSSVVDPPQRKKYMVIANTKASCKKYSEKSILWMEVAETFNCCREFFYGNQTAAECLLRLPAAVPSNTKRSDEK